MIDLPTGGGLPSSVVSWFVSNLPVCSDNISPGLLDFGVGVAGVEGDAKENIFDCFYTVNT